MKGFSGPDASEIDQNLAEIIRLPRKHQRTAAVRRLATRLYPDQSKLRLELKVLRKKKKVLKEQLRQAKIQKPPKAALGFKKKGAKSLSNSITDLNDNQKSQLLKRTLNSA